MVRAQEYSVGPSVARLRLAAGAPAFGVCGEEHDVAMCVPALYDLLGFGVQVRARHACAHNSCAPFARAIACAFRDNSACTACDLTLAWLVGR